MSKRARQKKPANPTEQLRAATIPPDPGQTPYSGVLSFAHFFLSRTAGVIVNEETALQYGAVFACIRVIAEDIAGLPWHVLRRRQDGGKDEVFDHPVDWLLDVQANPETPAFQFRETLIAHALTWGNGYAEIERDALGRPVWLWQITPDRVTPMRDERGNIVYEVSNYGRPATYLPAQDVFHLRGLGYDGLVGYSVIRMAARSIGIGISQEENAGEFFANDSTPGGVLKHPGTLSEKAKSSLMTSWERRHKGPENVRRVAVLEEGMAYEQVGLPPEDAQLIQSRQFQPEEICRWFRVAPHKIQHLLRSTFSNIEHQSLEHVNDTLMPWVRRLELEADIKLFGPINRVSRLITKMNVDSRLRGDSASRVSYITSLLSWGVLNINEARKIEGYNPVTDGDTHFVAVNMQRLEDAADEPEPPPAPTPQLPPPAEGNGNGEGEEEGEESGPDEEELGAYFRPLFLDAFTRIAHRAMHRVEGAKKKDPQGWQERLRPFWGEHEEYAKKQLESPCRALSGVLKREVICSGCVDGLKMAADSKTPGVWATWAETETDSFLGKQFLFDESQVERDDDGKFSSGGGGGSSGESKSGDSGSSNGPEQTPEREARSEKWDEEDETRSDARESEDERTEGRRDADDLKRESAREKEDDAMDRTREKEDAAREKSRAKEEKEFEKRERAREKEDAAMEKARDKEDKEFDKRSSEMDKEDARRDREREKEDRDLGKQRDAEDEHWEDVPDEVEAAREKEDAETESRREKEDADLQSRRDTLDREVVSAEERREKEDAETESRREKEDAEEQATRAGWEAEDEAISVAREKEDDGIISDRTREDADIQSVRDKEDSAAAERRAKEDAEIRARREVEDMELARAREGGVE